MLKWLEYCGVTKCPQMNWQVICFETAFITCYSVIRMFPCCFGELCFLNKVAVCWFDYFYLFYFTFTAKKGQTTCLTGADCCFDFVVKSQTNRKPKWFQWAEDSFLKVSPLRHRVPTESGKITEFYSCIFQLSHFSADCVCPSICLYLSPSLSLSSSLKKMQEPCGQSPLSQKGEYWRFRKKIVIW